MIQNYIKIAWRNLIRAKQYAFINIIGLSIGMVGTLLILIWILHEVSFDQFHERTDRIYEAYHETKMDGGIRSWNSTSEPLGPALASDYPEVEAASRYDANELAFNVDSRLFNQYTTFVDPAFFDIFSFEATEGDLGRAFDRPNAIVLSESTAKKLFGVGNAVGKTIQVEKNHVLTVSAILKDPPTYTRFRLDAITDWRFRNEALEYFDSSPHAWTNSYVNTFVLLRSGVDFGSVNQKIKHISRAHDEISNLDVFLYPSARWHLHGNFENGQERGGLIKQVYLLSGIAGFILLIACINFMNLSTARSEKRAKEVGIRKVAGAGKRGLVTQFMVESIVLAFISGLIALLIIALVLPFYEKLIGQNLSLPLFSPVFWLGGILFIVFTGFLAGSYPAFFLTSFQPSSVLKGSHMRVGSLWNPRKFLVVLQFTFAIALIICTLVVRKQIQHGEQRSAGYNRDQLVTIYLNDESRLKSNLIRQELLDAQVAASITKTGAPITSTWSNSTAIGWPGKQPDAVIAIYRYAADQDWAKTTGVNIIHGRDIDVRRYPTDSTAMLINETAVQVMGLENPVGQIIDDNLKQWTIVGVVQDFIINSPYKKVEPLIVAGPAAYLGVMTIRLNGRRSVAENIALMEKVFKKYSPNFPLDYEFVDQQYATKFKSEQRVAKLTSLFSGLSVFISCLGLFGLAAYTAEQRSKEIGVRKILGATVSGIVNLLSKDFIKLVAIAFVIASPIAYYAMDSWLQDFTYRASIEWYVFALTGLLAVLIAILTVSFQAVKAAVANPVDSLRDE